MIEIDGSAGGGQLLRTAISLSALSRDPVRVSDIRGARPEPGLRPQHLTAVRVAGEVCDAEVSGAEPGSTEVVFRPDVPTGGTYAAEIDTAGSVALLFDTLLPLSTGIDAPLVVRGEGGTDVKWSPTSDYYRRVKLPLLRGFGLQAVVDLDRRGFYPVGGGEATLRTAPSSLSTIELTERGAYAGARIYSTASMDLADPEVAERQAAAAADRLAEAGRRVEERTVRYVDAESTGSAIAVRLDYGRSITGFDALGERGTPAEEVGGEAADAAVAFDGGTAAVDEHMADQTLVFLALAGGRVSIPRVTDHVETSLDLLSTFGFEIDVEETADGPVLVAETAGPRPNPDRPHDCTRSNR